MIRRFLRFTGLAVAAFVVVFWLLSGADRGWTKTSVATRQIDEVTGLEYPVIENRFVPGIEFLALGTLAGLALSASTFFPISTNKKNP